MIWIALALALQAVAPSDDLELETCLRAQKSSDEPIGYITGCYRAALARAEAQLDVQFLAMIDRMRADGISIRDAEAARRGWVNFRTTWCRVEGVGDPDADARSLTNLQCRTELTQRFVARVASAYQR
jgi:uncharacterized protein YecT (DUF1311 family)